MIADESSSWFAQVLTTGATIDGSVLLGVSARVSTEAEATVFIIVLPPGMR